MRQLLAKGNHVHATARNASKAGDLDKLQNDSLSVSYVDTGNTSSIKVGRQAHRHHTAVFVKTRAPLWHLYQGAVACRALHLSLQARGPS